MKAADLLSFQMMEKGIIKEEDIPIYRYGIENGIILFLNMITAFIIGIITGRLIGILIFLLSLITLRSFAGGFHLDNKIACYICSNLILMIPAYAKEMGNIFLKIWNDSAYVIGIMFVLCVIGTIFFLCPMDSKKRKLDIVEKKHFKVRARMILIIQLVVIVGLYFIGTEVYIIPICISLSVIAVLMLIRKVQLVWLKN
jgi:Membrane protein putatively involved in post-translational modification of the autoinducing quorum-sensing peptide